MSDTIHVKSNSAGELTFGTLKLYPGDNEVHASRWAEALATTSLEMFIANRTVEASAETSAPQAPATVPDAPTETPADAPEAHTETPSGNRTSRRAARS